MDPSTTEPKMGTGGDHGTGELSGEGRGHGTRGEAAPGDPAGDDARGYRLSGKMFPDCPPPKPGELPDPRRLSDLMTFLEPDAGDLAALDALGNPSIPAGYTFLGQFITHDLTFDPTSIEERLRDPEADVNFRTPALDLDSLYGSGPLAMPWLYDRDHPGWFLLNRDDDPYDVQRNRKGDALMADPRNDENLVLVQLHVLFLKLHNRIADRLEEKQVLPPEERFQEARRLTILLYQHVVWNDYLPRICMESVLEYFRLGGARLFFRYETQAEFKVPYLPVEFNAVFRFGHAQAKPRYRLNHHFEADIAAAEAHKNLRSSGRPLTAEQRVDWSLFFPAEDSGTPGLVERTRLIRPSISSQVGRLPEGADGQTATLPEIDLRRAEKRGVASGNKVAAAVSETIGKHLAQDTVLQTLKASMNTKSLLVLPVAQIWPGDYPLDGKEAPLLYYVLREAEAMEGGRRLGLVGSAIIAEVIHGALSFAGMPLDEGAGAGQENRYGGDARFFREKGAIWEPRSEPCLAPLLEGRDRLAMSDLVRIAGAREPVRSTIYPRTP